MEPSGRPAGTDPWWSPMPRTEEDAVEAAPDDGPPPGARLPGLAGRPARAPRPAALPPARAVAGALVAVAGVALGIGTLLWATGGPERDAADPVVRPSVEAAAQDPEPALDEPAVEAVDAPAEQVAPPEPEPEPVPEPEPAAQVEPPSVVVPVLVLNNSRIPGLAERTAREFEAAGWPVSDTGSLRGRIRATTVYYPPGQQASAQELARLFPGIQRVLPRLENLPGSGLTVVVTRDYVS
jgi:hypothetical protein